jgi:hypothetical protein
MKIARTLQVLRKCWGINGEQPPLARHLTSNQHNRPKLKFDNPEIAAWTTGKSQHLHGKQENKNYVSLPTEVRSVDSLFFAVV